MISSISQSTVPLYDLHPPIDDFRSEILQGLNQQPKVISPKFLYDKRGAELFDAICNLDEYYLTRTEIAILKAHAQEIADCLKNNVLIEFGSGSSQKIRILFDEFADTPEQLPVYVGLDISKQHLQESCANLLTTYPDLTAIAVCADHSQSLQLPDLPALQQKQRIGFFPGSSIGNFEPEEAVQFLQRAAVLLGDRGSLLIGVDFKKSRTILEPAYDDPQGVSADFALNLLTRINRELNANFHLDQFTYSAIYNETAGRIEMHLVSLKPQTVNVNGTEVLFQQSERLRTEYSYKYSLSEFQELAASAGLQTQRVWTDPQQWFGLYHLEWKDS